MVHLVGRDRGNRRRDVLGPSSCLVHVLSELELRA
jgi:hypothetical protein